MSNGADPTSGPTPSTHRPWLLVRGPGVPEITALPTRGAAYACDHTGGMSRLTQSVVRSRSTRSGRVWLVGAVAGATVGGLLTALALAASPAQALGSIPVQCGDGKVVIETDGLSYALQGTCGVVVVKASDTVVDVPSSRRLVVRGHDNVVTARPGDVLQVRGRDNRVRIASTRALVAASPGSRVRIDGLVEKARLGRSGVTLGAHQISDLTVRGRGHDVTARRGYDARVPGDRNDLSFRRLDDVRLGGDHNRVEVRRAATRVTDSGRDNEIRVHRRR